MSIFIRAHVYLNCNCTPPPLVRGDSESNSVEAISVEGPKFWGFSPPQAKIFEIWGSVERGN